MVLEEYWERGSGPGEVRLPLEGLVRMTAEGCEEASLIRKTSGNGECDCRSGRQKSNGKLVMSLAAGRKEARRLRISYACLCSREGWEESQETHTCL
jgi:hypothetical protein